MPQLLSDAGKGGDYRPSQKPWVIVKLRHELAFGTKAQKQSAREQLKAMGDL